MQGNCWQFVLMRRSCLLRKSRRALALPVNRRNTTMKDSSSFAFQPPGRCCHQRPRGRCPAGGTAHRPLRRRRPPARGGRPCRRARCQPHRDPGRAERDGARRLHRAGARHRHRGQPHCARTCAAAWTRSWNTTR